MFSLCKVEHSEETLNYVVKHVSFTFHMFLIILLAISDNYQSYLHLKSFASS